MLGGPRVVIVHDYLTQRGGAERVTLDLLRAFPGARLVTSCWNPAGTYPEFRHHEIETLWIDRFGSLRRDPRRSFPFLARAFQRHVILDADVVICSSSGWAHRVATSAPKIVYCHNPARWLYQPAEYFPSMPEWMRTQFVRRTAGLRHSDAVAARGAAAYLVNSGAVADRVRATYGIDPVVLPPSRGLSPDGPQLPVPGVQPGYLLTVSRRRAYKHTETICDAVATMPGERLVVVGGTAPRQVQPGITHLSDLSDSQMRWLYSNAAGLVAVASEDFGLTPVEAQSFGIPSVLLRSGGYLDSMIENVTGVFIDDSTAQAVAAGIRALRARTWDRDALRLSGERYSRSAFTRRIQDVVADVVVEPSSLVDVPAPATVSQLHPDMVEADAREPEELTA